MGLDASARAKDEAPGFLHRAARWYKVVSVGARKKVGQGGASPGKGDVAQECYLRSVELLRKNSTPGGVIACAPSAKAVDRRYASIFGRDAAICAMGMAAAGEEDLVEIARRSLLTLAGHQALNGQIPKYVRPEAGEVDFWYSGCIDATLWWLIALHVLDREALGAALGPQLRDNVARAKNWLLCQEHQGFHLLQQNEASDWADVMPRSGFVLYSNALWHIVKRLWRIPGARRTGLFFRSIFAPFGREVPDNRRVRVLTHYIRQRTEPSPFFLSFVNFSFFGGEVDVLGNVLALLAGLAPASEAARMADGLIALGANEPWPVKVVENPILPESPLWRDYMYRHRQNLPYQYHNGGIWPFAGGFWVMLLQKLKRHELARRELTRLAEANRLGDWGFYEWLHGRTGQPMGMRGQSWNAATYIMAYKSVFEGKKVM